MPRSKEGKPICHLKVPEGVCHKPLIRGVTPCGICEIPPIAVDSLILQASKKGRLHSKYPIMKKESIFKVSFHFPRSLMVIEVENGNKIIDMKVSDRVREQYSESLWESCKRVLRKGKLPNRRNRSR